MMTDPEKTPLSSHFQALSLSDSQSASSPSTPGQGLVASPGTGKAPATPYDVKEELMPSHPLFTSQFQDALKDGFKVAKDVVIDIEKLKARDPNAASDVALAQVLADAKKLRHFQGSDTRTVAVLGDSGEGKSSLINSLLHFPGIAQTGDIGSACTSVVTEYRQKKPEQVAVVTIEVEYLSAPEIAELLQELLWSYRQLFCPLVESNDTSAQDYNRYARESEQAWSALQAAFKHKKQFTESWARDMSEGSLKRITDQLCQWAKEIEWPSSGVDGFWTSTAQTAEECVEQTNLFMQDRHWPFTKMIRIYIDAQVLKTGLVLADLPGLQDTNLARVRATQDYLIKCDNIVVVANIARAITDQSLKSSLMFVLSRHLPTEWEQSGTKNLKIAIVCTKSEEINLNTARSTFCGPNKRIPPEVMAQLDKEIKDAKASGDRVTKKAAKKKQELLLVGARNAHVKEGLLAAYSSKTENRPLDIFCVSNKWYEKYCRKGNTEFVLASGIPEIRQFFHTITADAQMNKAKHFLTFQLSSLLNSLNLWASSSLDKQMPDKKPVSFRSIYDDLDERGGKIPSLIGNFRREFNTCFQEQIMTFFERRDEYWEKASIVEGIRWKGWHWSQYNAWCLRNGNHETAKRDHEDWNAKIIWKMRMELEGQWDLIEEEVSDDFKTFLNEATDLLEGLKKSLRDMAPSEDVRSLVNSVDCHIGSLQYKINREQRKFLGEVKAIRRYASESNYTSYILQDMIPIYRAAANERGDGKGYRQKAIVQGHLEDGTVFPHLSIAIATSMENAVKAAERDLEELLQDILEAIRRDVKLADMFVGVKRIAQSGRSAERERQLKDFLDQVGTLKKRHERVLQNIEVF